MSELPMFVPECYIDTALMRTLLHDRKLYNHQHGIGNVGNVMERQARLFGPARQVIGMVDCDKKFEEQDYLSAFGSLKRGNSKQPTHHLLTHPSLPSQRLIVLNPACDAWVFRAAQEAGINPGDYGLPTTLPAFIKFCKDRGVADVPELRSFLEAIRRAYPPLYQELAEFVASVWPPAQSR